MGPDEPIKYQTESIEYRVIQAIRNAFGDETLEVTIDDTTLVELGIDGLDIHDLNYYLSEELNKDFEINRNMSVKQVVAAIKLELEL